PSPPRTKSVTRSTNIARSRPVGAGQRGAQGDNIDPPALLVELDGPLDQRIDRPIAADADVLSGAPLGAILAADDAAGFGVLAAEQLDAQHLRIRVAAVAARPLPFLVRHIRSAFNNDFEKGVRRPS